MSKKSDEAEKRKQQIMETAMQLFVTKGYEETSTNDIINHLQISRGGLYHHFKSKEDILDAAIYTVLLSETERVTAYIEDESVSASDKLKTLIEFQTPTQSMGKDVITMIHKKDNPTLLSHLIKTKLQVVAPLYEKIIRQAIREGISECTYPQEISVMSVILSTILFSDAFMPMPPLEAEKMIDAFRMAMEAMLGTKPGTFDFMNQSIKIGR